jgi:protein-disulfide isomerase
VSSELRPAVSEQDHRRGAPAAEIVLTVFGDYECPNSGRLWRVIRELRASNDNVQDVFRHFPLTAVHPHAFAAAQAAEAAHDQGVFWPMHDRLFEHQDALEIADLSAHAEALGLDVERFDEDLAYDNFADAVRRDQRSGVSSGVVTTATLFLNGSLLPLNEPEVLPTVLAERFPIVAP